LTWHTYNSTRQFPRPGPSLTDKTKKKNQPLSFYLIVAGEKPLRKIVTRKMRLERLKQNLNLNYKEQTNDQCGECRENDFVWDVPNGDIICKNCGAVLSSGLQTNDWADDPTPSVCSSGVMGSEAESRCSLFDPTYIRYFHFNEVLATLTLSGPWINNADYREIKNVLRERGLTDPTRCAIQDVCRHLNLIFGVQRFTKKYSEKWIQIVYRYNGKRPPELHPNLIFDLQRDFKTITSKWVEVEKLLNGSKKTDRRVQWPNYLETIYRLLKRKYPDVLTGLKPWITRLSKKKRKELKLFFDKVFKLVGF
jgi:hypothetical protein